MNRIVFDVCGTLYFSNTTFDFICYYHKKNRYYFRYLYTSLLTSNFGKLMSRMSLISIRKLIIKTISGEDKEKLDFYSTTFVDEVLEYNKNLIAFKIFHEYKETSPEEIVLLSASIDLVIEKIARAYGVTYDSSRLAYKNNICLGYLEKDMKGNKHNNYTVDSNLTLVVTDNHDDIELCKISQKCVIFSKPKHRNYWEKNLKHPDLEINIV